MATNGYLNINYGGEVGLVPFGPVVLATHFSDSGDSGSLVFDEVNNVVGLIFAGSGTVSIYCPIQPVLDHFGVWFS